MTDIETVNRIVNKLTENGWTILSTEYTGRRLIKARKNFSMIQITSEECVCHGGRMWITDEHCDAWTEISHGAYNKDLGITDSDSELKYIIDNEMIPALTDLSHMIYKVVTIRKKSSGVTEEKATYYNSLELATLGLFDNSRMAAADVFNDANNMQIGDEVTATFPNENMKDIFKRVAPPENAYRSEGRIYVKQIRFSRKDKKDEFTEDPSRYDYGTIRYLEVFRK